MGYLKISIATLNIKFDAAEAALFKYEIQNYLDDINIFQAAFSNILLRKF